METLELLKSPELVADIQKTFGLYRNMDSISNARENPEIRGKTMNSTLNCSAESTPAATTTATQVETTTSAVETELSAKIDEEETSNLRLRTRSKVESSAPDSEVRGIDTKLKRDSALANSAEASSKHVGDSSISSSLLNSGLEAHGIFSVRVAEQRAASPGSSGDEHEEEVERRDYKVMSQFWHVFFSLASNLGNEVFYCSFFPFWFWNVDTYVARRVIALWALNMYIGQALKDIIRWPRPASPPVIRLEERYALEYGMPSTHAMVGVAIPFGLLVTSLHRYNLILWLSFAIALAWTSSICFSRLYLGMHSVLDVIVGIALTILIMTLYLPFADLVDWFCLTNPISPVVVVGGTIFAAMMYPTLDRWSTARGDTTTVIGTNAGVMVGSWLNFHLGFLKPALEGPPYEIIYPSFHDIGLSLLRTCIGILILLATRAIVKLTVFWGLKLTFTINDKSKESLKVEIPYKFLPYATMGFMAIFFCPIAFDILNIARITSYTEM